jgi:hypothetical protein
MELIRKTIPKCYSGLLVITFLVNRVFNHFNNLCDLRLFIRVSGGSYLKIIGTAGLADWMIY